MTEHGRYDRYTEKELRAIQHAGDLARMIGYYDTEIDVANGKRITVYRGELVTGVIYLGTIYQRLELSIGATPVVVSPLAFREPPTIIWVGA